MLLHAPLNGRCMMLTNFMPGLHLVYGALKLSVPSFPYSFRTVMASVLWLSEVCTGSAGSTIFGSHEHNKGELFWWVFVRRLSVRTFVRPL